MAEEQNLPEHPLTRIREYLRNGPFKAASTRERLPAILGISRSTLGRLERNGTPFSAEQKVVISSVLDIHPAWLGSAHGPIIARDGSPWNPANVPALVTGRKLVGVVHLAATAGLQVLQDRLQAEQKSGCPGIATFGILKLAAELDGAAVAKAVSDS